MNGCLRWSDGPNSLPRGAGPRDLGDGDTPAIAADGRPALDGDAVDGNPLPDTDCERRIGVSTRPCPARDMGAAICRPLLSTSASRLGSYSSIAAPCGGQTAPSIHALFVYARVPEAEQFRPKDAGS